MKNLLYFFLFSFTMIGCSSVNKKPNGKQQIQKPNILFILADDLGAGDLQITGHPYAKTPNLDRLAANGIRFKNAYMASGWCAPSRYALMTGQYPAKEFNKTRNLNPNTPTITSLLKKAGYSTAHIGKWHLTSEDSKYASHPNNFGIDSFFMTNWNGAKIKETWTKQQKNKKYWRATTTDFYVDKAINFIENNATKKESTPFYLNLWIYPTHSYIDPTPEQLAVYKDLKVNYKDFSKNQQKFLKYVSNYGNIDNAMQAYCADITAMDKALGKLLDYLRNSGLDKNTIIVFTSDNGPGPLTHQITNGTLAKRFKENPDLLNSVGYAKSFKDRKLSLNEGGIRVPFIIKWEGKTPKGKIDSTSIIQGIDWLPTIANLCDVNFETQNSIDGENVTSAFLGKDFVRKKPLFWSERNEAAILIGDLKGYKLKNTFKLYNLKLDPSQENDITFSNRSTAAQMEKQLNTWLKSL